MGIAANLIFVAISACLYSIPFGVRGVFMAFPAAQILTLIICWAIHARRSKRALPLSKDCLAVDNSFHKYPGDIISYPLETMEDCTLVSEQVVLFCRGHKIDSKKGFLAGVCVEELATNAIGHGLRNQKGLKSADIRVVIDGGDVIIRLRDSGSAFNLKSFANQIKYDDNSEGGTGIRILLNSAKEVSYYRTYGMNTTIIKV